MSTLEPGSRSGKSLVCSDHFSAPLIIRFLKASSRFSRVSIHISEGLKVPGLIGRKSRMGLPNTICAGDIPNSVSGVFLCCISPLEILSRSGEPSNLLLSIIIRLADFTAVSALKLLLGKYEELVLCSTPHDFKKSLNKLDWNWGPLSL